MPAPGPVQFTTRISAHARSKVSPAARLGLHCADGLGFSAKWFPSMLSVREADAKKLRVALVLVVAAIFCGILGWIPLATVVLALGTVIVLRALRLFERTRNADRSSSWFVRSAYLWLAVAAGMSVWAAYADHHGGIWGASRHALTVGFAATMVFTIGPRILPFFAGVREIFSKRLATVPACTADRMRAASNLRAFGL